jgi:hypothetical protein
VVKRHLLKEKVRIRRLSETERYLFREAVRREPIVVEDPDNSGRVCEHYATERRPEGAVAAGVVARAEDEGERPSFLEKLARKVLKLRSRTGPPAIGDSTMSERRSWRSVDLMFLLAVSLLLLAFGPACSQDATVNEMTGPQTYGGRYAGGTATGDTDAGAAFARWVIDQDPQHRYLTGAVVRSEQTLGVKVQPNVTKGELRDLLVALTEGMVQTFPDRPIKVIAFYQSGDKLAEANYDPRTGQITLA